MMDNDEFLDWLESKRDESTDPNEDHLESDVLQNLIDDFSLEFDTRDSPVRSDTLKGYKKKPKKPLPDPDSGSLYGGEGRLFPGDRGTDRY